MTNAEPNGPLFNRRLRRWALSDYLGLEEADPAGEPRSPEGREEYEGTFATVSTIDAIRVDGDHLLMDSSATPELVAQLGNDVDVHEDPIPLWMLPGRATALSSTPVPMPARAATSSGMSPDGSSASTITGGSPRAASSDATR